LVNEGYSINVVQSDKWPHLHSYDAQQLLPEYAKWYLAAEVKPRSESYPKHLLDQVNSSRTGKHVTSLGWGADRSAGPNVDSMTAEEQIEYAMQQSLGQNNGGGAFGGGGLAMAEDPELAHALALSMKGQFGDGGDLNNGNAARPQSAADDDDEEAMLATALALSMEQDAKEQPDGDLAAESIDVVAEPAESEDNVCSIHLRLPRNKRLERRFKTEHTLNEVANFVKSEDSSFRRIIFVCPPSNSYHAMDITLDVICKELNSHKLSFIVKENQNIEKE